MDKLNKQIAVEVIKAQTNKELLADTIKANLAYLAKLYDGNNVTNKVTA